MGYNQGEQHIGKSKIDHHEDNLPPQAGTRGQPESHIGGQTGPEILGGNNSKWHFLDIFLILISGTASTRITGQSVDEQLQNPLPTHDIKWMILRESFQW